MAEIKSTLELVMERTRHLTLTEEDKREQALAEFKRSVNGLLTRFHDGTMRLDQFQAELSALQQQSHLTDRSIVIGEILSRLDLDGDNGWVLDLLEGVFRIDIQRINAVLDEFQNALEGMTQAHIGQMSSSLLERHGISGSAVIPNHAADPGWNAERQHLRERFESLLAREVTKAGAAGSAQALP